MFETLVNDEIDLKSYEQNDDVIEISVDAHDEAKLKNALNKFDSTLQFELDEVGYFAKDLVKLSGEDKETFDKLYEQLDKIDDVTKIFTNVEE